MKEETPSGVLDSEKLKHCQWKITCALFPPTLSSLVDPSHFEFNKWLFVEVTLLGKEREEIECRWEKWICTMFYSSEVLPHP